MIIYINTYIVILDIIHRSRFLLKTRISQIGFWLDLQMNIYQVHTSYKSTV
jgi:hypothetical protein